MALVELSLFFSFCLLFFCYDPSDEKQDFFF